MRVEYTVVVLFLTCDFGIMYNLMAEGRKGQVEQR